MAIIIDFTGGESRKETPLSAVSDPNKPAYLKRADYASCKHGQTLIDEEHRTVTCQACGTAVDPIAYILLLYHEYETRIDQRLSALREAEQRERERHARKRKREKPVL